MTAAPTSRLPAVGLLLVVALTACTDALPSATSSLGSPATSTAAPSPDPTLNAVPVGGRPYDAATLLAAMRGSTRPGGVPDELETDAVAASVAEAVSTWDGEPWDTLSVGGACGRNQCSLDVAGSRDGMAGADLYSFAVDRSTGDVSLEATDLHGYPAALDALLDQVARAAAGDEIGDLAFASARWLPPPDAGRYCLAYRTGGEEGAPGLDLLLDAVTGEILDRREV